MIGDEKKFHNPMNTSFDCVENSPMNTSLVCAENSPMNTSFDCVENNPMNTSFGFVENGRLIALDWQDYQIIATSNGEKLEKWGKYVLLRPDPQIIWRSSSSLLDYPGIHARYKRDSSGGGYWENYQKLPEEWKISYKDLNFLVKPMGFKHLGLFPEQAANWDIIRNLIENRLKSTANTSAKNALFETKPNLNAVKTSVNNFGCESSGDKISVLNLFAYTGGATVAAAKSGAHVTHVDAAKAMNDRAKENCRLSGVPADRLRFIADDCQKFVTREQRRGKRYDAIIMDPPSYGRGPNKELWKLEDNLFDFVTLAASVLSDNPLFFLINSYTTGLQPTVIENILSLVLNKYSGKSVSYELCIPTKEGIFLPCGACGLWVSN